MGSLVNTTTNMPPKTKKKASGPKKAIAKKSTAKKTKKEKPGYKRAKSAYMFFVVDQRSKIEKANPKATFGEVGKLLGEAWGKCKDKSKYEKQAEKDKTRAAKDKAAWEKSKK